ncbi:SRPBCC domain-containing protein [Pseudooceanicola sp.]|uniref:SRPBCC domain-containing protein n=1 Tax=Pseudooceanicola sp. TaxID=1914328 RepID=UPI0035184368
MAGTATGTRLRMEQTGFAADQPMYCGGAKQGWPRVLDALDKVLARLEKDAR